MNKFLFYLALKTWQYFVAACMGFAWAVLTVAADRIWFEYIIHPINLPLYCVMMTIVFCVLQDQYDRLSEKYKKM